MSGFTLHDIDDAIREVLRLMDVTPIDETTGAVDPELDAQLDGLEIKREYKLLSYAVVWKELLAEKKALSDEATLLTRRANRLATKQLWLEGRLENALPKVKGIALKDVRAQISYTRSERTLVDHPLNLPRKLLRQKLAPPPEPELAEVKKALTGKLRLTPTQQEQLDSSGARIVERFTLKIE